MPNDKRHIIWLAVYHAAVPAGLLAGMLWYWPPALGEAGQLSAGFIGYVMAAGALGSSVHSINSFTSYVGNDKFVASWITWYLLRPIFAAALAVGLFFAIYGGVVLIAEGGSTNPNALLAICFLSGMFSQKTADKLSDVFDVIMSNEAAEKRTHKLEPEVPELTAVRPPEVLWDPEEPAPTIVVEGRSFARDAEVMIDDRKRPTVFQTATELVVHLAPEDCVHGEHTLMVRNASVNRLSRTVRFSLRPRSQQLPVPSGGGEESREQND